MGQNTEVLVVGGGPAGLAAAIAASQRGFDVTVADGCAPPIEKPCGEGLLPAALEALNQLGVAVSPTDSRSLRGVSFIDGETKLQADFPHQAGIGLRRSSLHEQLVQRAQECGVNLVWNSPVSMIDLNSACVGGRRLRAHWVIGADGHSSRVRASRGLQRSCETRIRFAKRRHYWAESWSEYTEVHWGKHAQVYVTPVAKDQVCVVVLTSRHVNLSFEERLAEFPALRERLAGCPLVSRERGAITAVCSLRHVQQGNVALVGDASGGVDAITGDGLRLAFEQALAVADAMRAGDLGTYESFHRRLLQRPRRMAKLLLWLGRHALVRTRVFQAMSDRPELFAQMLEMHLGQGETAELIAISASLGWQLLGFSGS